MSNGTTELDRPVPLYMQVVRQLRAQIAAGELDDGDTHSLPAADDGTAGASPCRPPARSSAR